MTHLCGRPTCPGMHLVGMRNSALERLFETRCIEHTFLVGKIRYVHFCSDPGRSRRRLQTRARDDTLCNFVGQQAGLGHDKRRIDGAQQPVRAQLPQLLPEFMPQRLLRKFEIQKTGAKFVTANVPGVFRVQAYSINDDTQIFASRVEVPQYLIEQVAQTPKLLHRILARPETDQR